MSPLTPLPLPLTNSFASPHERLLAGPRRPWKGSSRRPRCRDRVPAIEQAVGPRPARNHRRLAAAAAAVSLLAAVAAAAEPAPGKTRADIPNAAVVHWQAFAVMPPPLGEPLKVKYDDAVAHPAAPVAAELEPVVDSFRLSLQELHRAAAVTPCDWNLDYDAGAECLLPHLERARTLSKAGLLRARLRFAEGEADEAVADVLAVLKLARDCGASPVLVSLLVDAAIEKSAAEVLAANLGRLSADQLDRLAEALAGLPPAPVVADCLRHEGRMFGDWMARFIDAEAAKANDPRAGGRILEGLFAGVNSGPEAEQARRKRLLASFSVADVRESLRLLRQDYATIAAIAAEPPARRRERFAEFEKAVGTNAAAATREQELRILSALTLPALTKSCERGDEADVLRALLAAAIDVRRRGPEAVRGKTVPGHGPIEHRARESGFELRCQPGSTDKPVTLAIAGGA